MEACSLLVSLRKGMQSSSKQPLVGGLVRDDSNNGCEGDYLLPFCFEFQISPYRQNKAAKNIYIEEKLTIWLTLNS